MFTSSNRRFVLPLLALVALASSSIKPRLSNGEKKHTQDVIQKDVKQRVESSEKGLAGMLAAHARKHSGAKVYHRRFLNAERGPRQFVTPLLAPSYTVTYSYDPLGRLSSMTDPSIGTIEYFYDPAGNRTTFQATGTSSSVNTNIGSNVITEANGVTARFGSVISSGLTSVAALNVSSVGILPNGFQLFSDSAAFNISTTASFQGSIGVCFNGYFNSDSLTFARLRIFHNENGVWVNRTLSSDFTNRTICSNVASLGQFAIALLGPPTALLDSTSNRAAALNSVTTVRDPVTIVDTHNFSADQRARLAFFVQSVDLLPAESRSVVTAQAEDAQLAIYPLTVESVAKVPNMDWLTEILVKLPDSLIGKGDVQVSVTVRGIKSEKVIVRIQ